MKRETSGFAVDVKRSYWVVGGGCTWSKEKNWRFAAELEDAGAAVAAGPVPGAVVDVDSIEMEVEEVV